MLYGNDVSTVILDEHDETAAATVAIDWPRIQSRLKQLRFHVGQCDGVAGTVTRQAIAGFQLSRGLAWHGWIDRETMIALFGDDDPQLHLVEV